MRYIFIIAVVLLVSCKDNKPKTLDERRREIETGSLDSTDRYTAEEIGWTVTIPKGWEVRSREDVRRSTEKGKEIIEKTTGSNVDASGLNQLLNIRKDQSNSFISTAQAFDEKTEGDYKELNKMVRQTIVQAYAAKNIKYTQASDSTLIDGLMFEVFKIKIYHPKDARKVILNQVMFSRLIHGYDVGFTMNYNDEESKKELEDMLFNSKFSYR